MPDQTVPTPSDTGELTGYAATAAELRRIADALDTLPPGDEPLSGQLYLFPHEGDADAVDAILFAINGTRGKTRLTGDHWAHSAWISLPNFSIYVKAVVAAPPDERDVELERLRAENAKLRSAEDPDHGRTTAVAEAKPDTLMVPHGEVHRTSAVEMQTRPQCSSECADEVMADGKSHPDAGWHHDGCPNAFRPGAEDEDGSE